MKKIISTIIAGLLLSNINAQEWVRVWNPKPSVYNLRPYYYNGNAATPNLTAAQRNVSDGVAIIKSLYTMAYSSYYAPAGTATIINTDPKLNYVCLLTAAHVVNGADFGGPVSPKLVMLPAIGWKYRRTATENWGTGFGENIDYQQVNDIACEVLGMDYQEGTDSHGDPVAVQDWAILAYPKDLLPDNYYEVGYKLTDVLPQVSGNYDNEWFVVHHWEAGPQRIAEITNAHQDVARNTHFAETLSALEPGMMEAGHWSNGSFGPGSSGAAFISNGQIVGVLSSTEPTNAELNPQSIRSVAMTDNGKWVGNFNKMFPMADVIKAKCGCNDEEEAAGRRAASVAIAAAVSQVIPSQAALQQYSRPTGGIQNYTHVGDALISCSLGNIKANMHTKKGNIYLKPGFKAKMQDGVSVAIGTITSFATTAAAFAAPSAMMSETQPQIAADGIAEKVQQSFKVFPSLTKGILNVSPGSYTENYTIRIVDMNGNELYKENSAAGGSRQMDLSAKLKAGGMYLVQIFPAGQQAPVTWKIEVLK